MRVMSDYVRETLFFSEKFRLCLESVDLRKIALAVCEITFPRAAAAEVAVVMASSYSETICADDVLLQRMLANIVNNAIDASPRGGCVMIEILNLGAESVRVQVSDQGEGIAAENKSRIFDPFFTTKKSRDENRGVGLGLTITQKIALLHSGRISVQSEQHLGTTVTVDLPKKLLSFEESKGKEHELSP